MPRRPSGDTQQLQAFAGDARHLEKVASHFPSTGFDVILTSPPYWQRRDYQHPDQLGQEPTPEAFVETLADTVASWAQWLAPHGSVFINLADTHRNGFLVGTPVLFELAMRQRSWQVPNRIMWSKPSSVPCAAASRLPSRYEQVLQLVPPRRRGQGQVPYYFDRFALTSRAPQAELGDVWHVSPSRGTSGHVAPFPLELARRILLLACPEAVCSKCGKPYRRQVGPSEQLNPDRQQARQAMKRFAAAGLTKDHLAAIRAVGISDTGMGKKLQHGAGRNSPRVQQLADEAKTALGGYFREFTFAPKEHLGWEKCGCGVSSRPGCVLDPFAGSNTSLYAAKELGFSAIGVDLTPHQPPLEGT